MLTRAILGSLRFYRYFVSPWTGNQCRFYPSCSHYASEAIARHGAIAGGWMVLKRVSRCHPWHPGGIDPVPEPPHRQLKNG